MNGDESGVGVHDTSFCVTTEGLAKMVSRGKRVVGYEIRGFDERTLDPENGNRAESKFFGKTPYIVPVIKAQEK